MAFQTKISVRHPGLIAVILLLCLLGGASCFKPAGSFQDAELKSRNIRRLLVMPFQDLSKTYGENVNFRCRLCGKVFTTGFIKPEAAPFLTQQLHESLERLNIYEIIPASVAHGAISGLLDQAGKELSEVELYVKTGQLLQADGVLMGYVHEFKDRKGVDYSVENPASVAFHMDIIHTKTGRVIWSKSYQEAQRALSEDLFQMGTFIRRKGRWVSAEDLAVYGLEQIVKTLVSP